MSIITLTTDYGLKDHFVGALKGKILSEYAEAKIIDISHYIDPFNTVEASYIISAAYSSFPKGTIHLIGVDMESNKENKLIVMKWNDHYFIAADNGILSMLTQKIKPQKIVAISISDLVSDDSTDIAVFVYVACHLAKNGLMDVMGKKISEIKEVSSYQAIAAADHSSLKGNVIYIDHFGNIVTNITKEYFSKIAQGRTYEIELKTKNIKNILSNYSAIATSEIYPIKYYEGEKLAIFNEAGFLEIAIFRSNPSTVGSAASLLGLNYQSIITIIFSS